MSKSKILVTSILILYILFAFFEATGEYNIAFHLNSLIIPLIAIIYLVFVKNKSRLFLMFLLIYSISDIYGIITDNILYYFTPNDEASIYYEYDYYIGNSLYILAYLFLFFQISSSLNFAHVFNCCKIHILVLTILNIYLVYVLQVVVEPNLIYKYDYFIELIYNIVVLLLLSASLLNFFYRDNKKSLYLFLGSLFIVFSEVLDIAYIYIAQRSLINILGTTLAIVAFYFYFQQSKLEYNEIEKQEEENYIIAD